MTPASNCHALVRYATPGVGKTPTESTSAPMEVKPAVSAASNMWPEILVSLPTNTRGRRSLHPCSRTWAPQRPKI